MKFKFLLLLYSLVLLPATSFAQDSFEALFKKAKDAYFKKDFESAITHFEKIQDLSAVSDSSWKNYYDKCQKAYIRSLKKDLDNSKNQLTYTLKSVSQKDSLFKETNYELENKTNALVKLNAEKTVLESLYTSPYQKWEKAKLALQAYKLSAKLPTNERPKELYAAILDASLNIGENSWTKTMLEGTSIQHINYDTAKELLSLGFSTGQTVQLDSFHHWIEYPDSLFKIDYSKKIELQYPIQAWTNIPGKNKPLFVAGPRIYNTDEVQEEQKSILAHEKSYIKGILSSNSNTVLTFGSDNFIKKMDLATGVVTPLMAHTGIIADVIKRKKNNGIYFASSNGVLFKINESNTAGLSMISNTLPNQISKIHILEEVTLKDSKKNVLMTGQESGEITFYELSDSKTKYIRRFSIHRGKIQTIQQVGNKLYVYAQDGMVSIWEIDKMLTSYSYLPVSFQMEAMAKSIQFVPQKELILYGTKDGDIKAISMDFEKHLQTICEKYLENNPLEESEELPEFLKFCK
ncbi:MAG: WD40 repeat domain-containing protein [Saprospiraceae bacterium]|nr:WD40 repeat domain-containing protein [Saprospiraceae bacterium]